MVQCLQQLRKPTDKEAANEENERQAGLQGQVQTKPSRQSRQAIPSMVLGGKCSYYGVYIVGDSLMGYRSEVCGVIAVDDRDPEKFKELIGKIKLIGGEFLDEIGEGFLDQLGEGEVGWGGGVFMFHVEDWKWYDDSPPVMGWNAIWDMANAMEGVSGMFIRIGEEVEDNVVEYFGRDCYRLEDYARISRSIVFDDSIIGTTKEISNETR